MSSNPIPDVRTMDASVIKFSKVWEDYNLLRSSLEIKPDDVIVSVTR